MYCRKTHTKEQKPLSESECPCTVTHVVVPVVHILHKLTSLCCIRGIKPDCPELSDSTVTPGCLLQLTDSPERD